VVVVVVIVVVVDMVVVVVVEAVVDVAVELSAVIVPVLFCPLVEFEKTVVASNFVVELEFVIKVDSTME
jgi:hypothetical protein